MVAIPLAAFNKYFSAKSDSDVRVKVKDKTKLADAKDELTDLMRRVRGLPPAKSSFFSGGNPRTRRIKSVSSSLASASLVLSFTLTRTSESLLAEKYLLNAANGIATIESQLNKPRKVPCRVFTPTTLNNCPLINTDLSIGLWEGKSASATS